MKVWFAQPRFAVQAVRVDLRVGGRYAITFRPLPQGEPFDVSGVYRKVEPPRELVFTWSGEREPGSPETLVTVEFREVAGGTEVVLTHERVPTAAARDAHRQGWEVCFRGLESYLAHETGPKEGPRWERKVTGSS
jgi:glutathione S-transferase